MTDKYERLKKNIEFYAIGESGILSLTLKAAKSAIIELQEENANFITTIESQKEEIKRLSTCQDCGGTGTNELCHDPYYVVPCICTVDWYSENMELRKQVDSLKAITELAVKENERLVKFLMDFRSRTPYAMYIEMIDGVLMTNIPQTQKGDSHAQN